MEARLEAEIINHLECDFDGWKLLPIMDPLPKEGDKDQSAQVHQEEGQALARYVMKRFDSRWQWRMSPDR